MATTDPITGPDTAVPAILDITPQVTESELPDDDASVLELLRRFADRLGCDLVPRGENDDHGTERVIRR